MVLSDGQVERYSRQIIVPGIGGRAQERLLHARIVLAGDLAQIEAPLAYLIGAGVGAIDLAIADLPNEALALAERMRGLNSDVTVRSNLERGSRYDLVAAFVATAASLATVANLAESVAPCAFVIARLDSPPRIGVFPNTSPCPLCARQLVLNPSAKRASEAGLVSMLATTEVFKLLVRYSPHAEATVIDLAEYQSRPSRVISARDCRCAKA